MKNVLTLYRHARLAMAAAFLVLLLLGPGQSISPNGVDPAHAAGTLTVSVGGPYSGTTGVAITMTANVTSATTSPIYTWNFGDGSGATGQSVTHVYGSSRTYYRVSVTVVDATGASGVASTTVTLNGGSSTGLTVTAHGPYSGTVGTSVTMSANASDASPRFTWNFGDGTTATGQTVSHTYGTATTYTVTVSVTDTVSGATGSTTTSASIAGSGSTGALTVTAYGPYSGTVGVPISMYASATDSSPVYTWYFGDGSTASGATVSHTYSAATTYTVTVDVTDSISGANGSNATSATITSSGSTGAISVSAGGPYTGSAGVAITMSATANDSYPSYTWNFGDGTTGYGQTVSHAYSATTSYTVSVTVTDSYSGLTGTANTTASTNGSASTTYEYCNGTYELASQCSTTTGYQECDGTLIPTTTVCGYSSASAYTCGYTYSCSTTSAYSSTCGVTYSCGATTNPYLANYQSTSPYTSTGAFGSYGGASTGAFGSYGGASTGAFGSYGGAPTNVGTTAAAPLATTSNVFAGHTNPLTGQGFNSVPQTSTFGSSGTGLPTTSAAAPSPTGSSVTYSSGWNLVAGTPGETLANVVGGPLAFSPAQDSYQSVDPSQGMQSGQGYWVNFSALTTANMPAAGGQQASVPIPSGGYVLVGDSSSGPLTVSGADAVWTYNPSSGSYTQTTTLNPGQAGWAYSAAGATASFSSSGAATTTGGS